MSEITTTGIFYRCNNWGHSEKLFRRSEVENATITIGERWNRWKRWYWILVREVLLLKKNIFEESKEVEISDESL